MVLLYVYDGSDVNRRRDYIPLEAHPLTLGFREGLRAIAPPSPFLLRGLIGDTYFDRRNIGKPTFGGRGLDELLGAVVDNGHDKTNVEGLTHRHPYEVELARTLGLKFSDMLWAGLYETISAAVPYRYFDDMGMSLQGFIHDFSYLFS